MGFKALIIKYKNLLSKLLSKLLSNLLSKKLWALKPKKESVRIDLMRTDSFFIKVYIY